jgi:hypothetical protein
MQNVAQKNKIQVDHQQLSLCFQSASIFDSSIINPNWLTIRYNSRLDVGLGSLYHASDDNYDAREEESFALPG